MKQEIKDILNIHYNWVNSGGIEGKLAILRDANLRGADLRGANLRGADLRGADLRGAKYIISVGPLISGHFVYAVKFDKRVMYKTGCFWGTAKEFRKFIRENQNREENLLAVSFLEKAAKLMWYK